MRARPKPASDREQLLRVRGLPRFTREGDVDPTQSNYALDHPNELFELGSAPPAVVRLLQSPPVAAAAILVGLLACCLKLFWV